VAVGTQKTPLAITIIRGELKRDNLIAGDYPLKAMEITIENTSADDLIFERGAVVAQHAGTYRLAEDDDAVVGIICDDITVKGGSSEVSPMYIKGEFNRRALIVAGTLAKHERRMIEIGLLVRSTRV